MIDTRLTRLFGLTSPVVLAPMPGMADGRLASAVARAGGLGMIGVGEQNGDWIAAQFRAAGNESVGCGFSAAHLKRNPDLLDVALKHRPRAIFLTGGDPRPFAPRIAQAKTRLICQVHDLQSAAMAVEAGAHAVVARGEAGGRSTLCLLPEVADYLHHADHDIVVLAAGGIADARGLAACLMLGADGVLMGTRLWASAESDLPDAQIRRILQAQGDHVDAVPYSGESIGLIREIAPVQDILNTISHRASRLMKHAQRKVIH